jgi:zinc protease
MPILTLALLAAPALASAQGTFPTRPPAATALRPVQFPPFVRTRLPNGMAVLLVVNHEQPVVSMQLTVRGGTRYEPEGKSGLAGLVADLLTKGTGQRTAEQIAAEVEGAGGRIAATSSSDFLSVSVSGLAENLPGLLNVLADVVTRSTFPISEFTLSQTRAISAVRAQLGQPAALADRAFRREVYGQYPYARSETAESLRGASREDVLRFYGDRVKPQGALLVVAGDFDPARVARLLESAFAGWTGRLAPEPGALPAPVRSGTEIVVVHRASSVQSNILAGFTLTRPADPNFYAIQLMNRVLGAGAESRLERILREERRWTYSARSTAMRPLGLGRFQANTEVRTEVTDSAIAELVRQLDRIRDEPVPDSELTDAKAYVTGSFPLSIETPEQVAQQVATARLLGLPDDYVQRYRERVAAVTGDQVKAVARRYLTTDRMVIVVVGDGTRILTPLRALGYPIRIVSAEGAAMTEEDLRPRSTGPAYEPARITPGTSRYRILVQGNPFGEEVRTIARVQEAGRDAWQVITTTSLGPILSQNDTTVIDAATLRPIRVRQGGRVQGNETFVRLDYAGGRVRGQSRSPAGMGQPMNERTIDTTVTDATLDDNQMAATLLALPFAAGARFSMPVFSGGEGVLKTYTAAVVGEESVTVPAGTFACWKVEVTGATTPITFYVAKDTPQIVKLELTGAPLAFELTQQN